MSVNSPLRDSKVSHLLQFFWAIIVIQKHNRASRDSRGVKFHPSAMQPLIIIIAIVYAATEHCEQVTTEVTQRNLKYPPHK